MQNETKKLNNKYSELFIYISNINTMIKIGTVSCTLDNTGNIYFTTHNNITYDIVIDSDDNLTCSKTDLNTLLIPKEEAVDIAFGEITLFDEDNTLHSLAKKKHTEVENDPNEDVDEIENETVIKKKYYPEDIDFDEYISDNDSTKPYCSISCNIEDKIVTDNILYTNEYLPLYETIIYDGTIESKHFLIKTKIHNELTSYRLCIYTSGDITFRGISNEIRNYKLNDLLL